MKLNDKAKEFIETLKLFPEWNAYTIFTQAYLESGAFRHIIGNFNCWGIKKPKKWEGVIIKKPTKEYIDKKWITVDAEWIDFETCFAAISWFCGLIQRLYPDSYINRCEPIKYFEGLVSGRFKYATDPNYVKKLTELYNFLKERVKL